MMKATYCERWNDKLRQPIAPLTTQEAHARDVEGKLYTVSLGDGSIPETLIEVRWEVDYLGVWFLDDAGNRYLKYSFTKESGSQLFLDNITAWNYPTEVRKYSLNEAESIDEISYRPDGVIRVEATDNRTKMVEVTDKHSVDVSAHWEPVPQFGEWQSVARWDRDQPPPDNAESSTASPS